MVKSQTPTTQEKVEGLIITDEDLEWKLGIESIDREIEKRQKVIDDLEIRIKILKEEVDRIERKKVEYKGGMMNHINRALNMGYHTLVLILHVFLGYIICAVTNLGLSAWKSEQAVLFYIIFSIGYSLTAFLEHIRLKKEGSTKR